MLPWLPAMAEDTDMPKAATLLLKALLKPAGTQVSDSEANDSTDQQGTNDAEGIRVSPQGKVEIHVRDLELSTVLEMLSMQSQRNIVASKNVSGKVTANFYGVTFNEA